MMSELVVSLVGILLFNLWGFLFVFFVLFCFGPRRTACRILVPRPGIEPRPAAVKAWSPNH